MKHLLIALNSQYVHTNLAVRYLHAACAVQGLSVDVREYTVNQDSAMLLTEIVDLQPDTAAFSCYIWNIELALRLCSDLKSVMPGVKILLGGPEVSFRAQTLLIDHPYIDFVLCGEGEAQYPSLLHSIETGCTIPAGEPPDTYPVVPDLDALPSPYTPDMLRSLGGRIIYYESSRGCPFGCAYCLSPACGRVRAFSLDRVALDLRALTEAGVSLIKFVDRTFNHNRSRTLALLSLLRALPGNTRYHFEIGGDLLDEEVIEALCAFPPGTLQLEMGVQSTHTPTLAAVGRAEDTDKLLRGARLLMDSGRVHLHLDLIAGLPFEGETELEASFNTVYAVRPHTLQLGFLKLLHGSALRRDADKYGIVFRAYPPYEVLETPWMPAHTLLALKQTEEALDRLYNSGRFARTLRYLERFFPAPFAMYQFFGASLRTKSAGRPLSALDLYALVYDTGRTLPGADRTLLADLLRYDQCAAGATGQIPGLPSEDERDKQTLIRAFLDTPGELDALFPHLAACAPREQNSRLRFTLTVHDPVTLRPLRAPSLVIFDRLCKNSVNSLCKGTIWEP